MSAMPTTEPGHGELVTHRTLVFGVTVGVGSGRAR